MRSVFGKILLYLFNPKKLLFRVRFVLVITYIK